MLPKRMTVTQVREAREGHPRLLLQQVIFLGTNPLSPFYIHSIESLQSGHTVSNVQYNVNV